MLIIYRIILGIVMLAAFLFSFPTDEKNAGNDIAFIVFCLCGGMLALSFLT